MPFVMVNCGKVDKPYALDEGAIASTSLESCQQMEYVVAECVAILQQEEERIQTEKEAVATAEAAIPDFVTCQQTFTTPSTTTEGTDTTTTEVVITLDCPTIVTEFSEAFMICASLDASEKHLGCDNVEEVQGNAETACAASSIDATFCETFQG